MRGRVKWFNDAKGYGFIAPEDGSPDVFCHFSAIQKDGFKSIAQGAIVEYDVKPDVGKGPSALNVREVAA